MTCTWNVRLKHIETLTTASGFSLNERALKKHIKELLSKIDAQNVLLHHRYDEVVNAHLDDKKFLISRRWRLLLLLQKFNMWIFDLREQWRLREIGQRVMLRKLNKTLLESMHLWAEMSQLRRKQNIMNLDNAKYVDALRFEIINHIFRRWLRGVIWEAFRTWGRIIVRQQLKIAEDRGKFLLMRMRHDLLVGGFQKLKAFRFTCKLRRHQPKLANSSDMCSNRMLDARLKNGNTTQLLPIAALDLQNTAAESILKWCILPWCTYFWVERNLLDFLPSTPSVYSLCAALVKTTPFQGFWIVVF